MFNSFASLKDSIKTLAKSPRGLVVLCLICFLEPIFLPLFPEVVIAPILLNRPKERFKIILLATLASLTGTLVAYGLAYMLGSVVLTQLSEQSINSFFKIRDALNKYGVLIPFLAALFPLPLKLVTWTCGLSRFNMGLLSITISLGRLLRYSLLLLIPKARSPQS